MSERPGYFNTLFARFGEGWNRFWFTPSDPLPLAVLRIAVGSIVLYLIATFGFDLRRFFDPQTGLLPLQTVLAVMTQREGVARFSYFDYAPDGLTLQLLHYVGVAIVAAFVVGFQTRITSVLSWLVFLSYFHRGPMLAGISEPVLSFLMLYLCIGPSGAELSVDAALRRRRGPALRPEANWSYLATLSIRLIQVHVTLVYVLMFLGKQSNFVWWNGTAAWWLIARPESALLNLRFLGNHPYVINAWTSTILFFELAFPLLVWNRLARPLLLGLSAFVWLGTALITGLVPFCLAMLVAGLAFVPAEFWRGLTAPRTTTATAA
jgi:hypothetical protein